MFTFENKIPDFDVLQRSRPERRQEVLEGGDPDELANVVKLMDLGPRSAPFCALGMLENTTMRSPLDWDDIYTGVVVCSMRIQSSQIHNVMKSIGR